MTYRCTACRRKVDAVRYKLCAKCAPALFAPVRVPAGVPVL